jgi:hypothetical protein
MFTTLIHLPQFQVQYRWSVLRALDVYAVTKLDFGDALIIASMAQKGSHLLYSYITDFDHFLCLGSQLAPALCWYDKQTRVVDSSSERGNDFCFCAVYSRTHDPSSQHMEKSNQMAYSI